MNRTGLILEPGPEGRCDDFRLGGAIVRPDPHSGFLHMWYYCRNTTFDGPSTLGTGFIAHALSEDGFDWKRDDGSGPLKSVFAPSEKPDRFDTLHVGLTDVTRPGDEWLMWYFGGTHTPQPIILGGLKLEVPGIGMSIGLASSPDGRDWKRIPGSAFNDAQIDHSAEAVYAAWPNVVHLPDRILMQYTSPTKDLSYFHTRVAQSDDGRNWHPLGDIQWAQEPSAHIAAGIVTRQIMENPIPGGRRYLMIFTAVDADHKRSIACADSDDALVWHELYGEPVFSVGANNAWDSLGVAANSMIVRNGHIHFYYYGFQSLGDDNGARGIGLATCPIGDLRQLERYTGK